jgi:hypothetical protein
VRAARGKFEQRVFAEAEDRAAQHGGQGQVVLLLDEKAPERHQVLDGDVGGQRQPVGAGNGNALFLEAPGQSVDEAVALAHQHHHVAGGKTLSGPLDHFIRLQPVLDGACHRLGDAHRRRLGMVDTLRPVVGLVDLRRADRWPDFDIARRIETDRIVPDGIRSLRNAATRRLAFEDLVDSAQHVVGRTERES